jgi:homoserine kinase
MNKGKTEKKTRRPTSLHLVLPATSANLGPAFDAAALAMNLFMTIDARPAASFSIAATGRDEDICGAVKNHLILATYTDILQGHGLEVMPLTLRIKNDIPIGKGCGSSAAARLAGIALANHFGHLRWTAPQIIGEASRREKHSDNASACWMGGLTVARMSGESMSGESMSGESMSGESMSGETQAQVVPIRPKGKWPLLLAVPDEALSTEKARRVLPEQYSRADAVANIQNSMLLLAAFTQGRHNLLTAALQDRIHQPYRAPFCPLLPALQELTGKPGVLGAALSGAGPSVIVFLDPRSSAGKTRNAVAAHLAGTGLGAELLLTSISPRGARLSRGKPH